MFCSSGVLSFGGTGIGSRRGNVFVDGSWKGFGDNALFTVAARIERNSQRSCLLWRKRATRSAGQSSDRSGTPPRGRPTRRGCDQKQHQDHRRDGRRVVRFGAEQETLINCPAANAAATPTSKPPQHGSNSWRNHKHRHLRSLRAQRNSNPTSRSYRRATLYEMTP